MNTTSRTRYHVGMNEIGLDPEYRIECLPTLEGARVWLEADITNTAEDVEDDSAFDALLDKLAQTPDAEIVGEHHVDAFVFWVRAVEDCGCPCDCAENGRADKCDGEHEREAADEPQLSEPDEQGRSTFKFDGADYVVYNTAGRPLDGHWAVEQIAADGSPLPLPESLLMSRETREGAFALAVEKLRPTRLITFLPRIFHSVTDDDETREANAYPVVDLDGWVCAWSADGYAVVFEDRVERGTVWPAPFEASVNGKDGRSHELDGEWRCFEQAVSAVRAHVLDSRA